MLVHREETTGSPVFRRHVGNGGTVRDGHVFQAVTVEFHELTHDTFLAQHFGDGQYQIRCGNAFAQLAGNLEADHFRNQHGHRLAQHGRFRFDTTHTPAEDAKAVDHGGVGVCAHQGIRVGDGFSVLVLAPHGLTQILQVHLVTDTGPRRHHAEIVERLLAPTQELIAFLIAFHLDGNVVLEG